MLKNGETLTGVLSITELSHNETDGLLASGTFTYMVEGEEVTQNFTDIPADLTRTMGALSSQINTQQSHDETGKCDVLFLDLGPLFLDVLGLQVDLSQVLLDIDAQQGSGNLLGNLLCAVTGLLDSGGIVDGLLKTVNNLLG